MKKIKSLSLVLPVITIVLEILPYVYQSNKTALTRMSQGGLFTAEGASLTISNASPNLPDFSFVRGVSFESNSHNRYNERFL